MRTTHEKRRLVAGALVTLGDASRLEIAGATSLGSRSVGNALRWLQRKGLAEYRGAGPNWHLTATAEELVDALRGRR